MFFFLWLCLLGNLAFGVSSDPSLVRRSPGKGPAAEYVSIRKQQGLKVSSQERKRAHNRQRRKDVDADRRSGSTKGGSPRADLGYVESKAETKTQFSELAKQKTLPYSERVYAGYRASGPATAEAGGMHLVPNGATQSVRQYSDHKAEASLHSTTLDSTLTGKGQRVNVDAKDFGGGNIRVEASGPGYKTHSTEVPRMSQLAQQYRGSPSRPVSVTAKWGPGARGTITSMNPTSDDWDKGSHDKVHQMENL